MKNRFRIFSWIIIGSILIISNGCNKDNDEPEEITDADGNVYTSVKIGTQTWMVENLRTTKYSNGDLIATTSQDISNESEPKYQWAPDGNVSNLIPHGRLYTWYVASDSRNVCPAGWHVPSDTEWTALENYLIANGYNYDGTKSENKLAKSIASATGWATSSNEGTPGNTDFPNYRNKSGFTALPGGNHSPAGEYIYYGNVGYWLSSTTVNTGVADCWIRYIIWDNPVVIRSGIMKNWGVSVRCIKD